MTSNPESRIPNPDPLIIAGRTFTSRLIVGTGKYTSFAVMQRAHEASGADMVTVAVRRERWVAIDDVPVEPEVLVGD